jgi:hypothetical protein
MNALTRRLAACLIAALSCVVLLAPAPAGALHPDDAASQQQPTAQRRTTAFPHLAYYGGRVLSRVKVDLVVWDTWSYGRSVPLTGARSIASFFAGITASRYLDWLSEYNTTTQHIGRGSLERVYTVRPPSSANGSTVSSAQIDRALAASIDAGKLPKPDTNRFYVIFFRSGQTISRPHGNSETNFCAYHDTMKYGSTTARFAVIPYELQNRGCRPASTSFDSVTTIVSHELVEGITDPGVGLGRIAWYDRNYGEIGDICASVSSPGSVTGGDGVHYVVQREWSNRARACVLTR